MSEVAPSATIVQSLQEIATLLLMFHENYFDNEETTVLESLHSFIADIGLSSIVSLLDIERCRRIVTKDSVLNDPMSYELFYSWLREVAEHVYKIQHKVHSINNEGSRRKALHLLLTKYIIPFATSEATTVPTNDVNKNVVYDSLKKDLFDSFLQYDSFIHLWWLQLLIIQNHNDKEPIITRFTPVETLRYKCVGLSKNIVTVEFVIFSFKDINFITETEVRDCLESILHVKFDDDKGIGQQYINFVEFLCLLEHLSVRTNTNNIPLNTKITTFIQRIGNCLFRKVFESFHALEAGNSTEGFSSNNFIDMESLFLLMRQAGVTQFESVSIKSLYDLAIKNCEQNANTLSRAWSEKHVFSLLLGILTAQKDCELGLNASELREKAIVRMLIVLPSLFFVSSKVVPSIISDIWKADFINYIKDNENQIYSIYESCYATFCNGSEDNHGYISIENLVLSLERFGLIPKFLRQFTVTKACELVVGMGNLDQNTLVGREDFIEIMHICAQICFSGDNLEAEKFKDLNSLERFIMLTSTISNSGKNSDSVSDNNRKAVSELDPFMKNNKDIYVLLVHYPKNSFKLSPWNVLRLLLRCKEQISNDHASYVSGYNIEQVLPKIFREFCDNFSVSAVELGAFLSSFFSDENSQLKYSILETLSDSFYLNVLLDERVLKLLQTNEELLRWEFVRLVTHSQNSRNSKNMFKFVSPIPTNVDMSDDKLAEHAIVSCQTMLSWAVETFRISDDMATAKLKQTFSLMGSGKRTNQSFEMSFLTFSTFVVYALHCCSDGLDTVVTDIYLAKVKSMLKVFSASLTMVQTTLKFKFSYVLTDSFHSCLQYIDEYSKLHDIESNLMLLVQTSMKLVAEGLVLSTEVPFVPPSPPNFFYDGPRFLEYCKFSGILMFINDFNLSFVSLWYSYSAYLNTLNGNVGFSIHSVSPLPMKADAISLYQLLKFVFAGVQAINGTEEVDNPSILANIMSALLPIAASYIEQSKIVSLNNCNSDLVDKNYISLEHILRYGGQRLVQVVYSNRDWLRQVFNTLKNKVDVDRTLKEADTISFPTLCNYMSCNGLLLTTIVITNIRTSLHPKIRSAIHDSAACNDYQELKYINLCYVEFEEVLMRCAFSLWELSATGLNNSSDPSIILASIADLTLSSSKYLRNIVTTYSNAATEVCQSINADSNWGVDFVSPYIASLKQLDALIRKASNTPTDVITSHAARNPGMLDNSIDIVKDDAFGFNKIATEEATSAVSSSLIELTKEELWPVFATFCSCGDSTDPGMLSGPNLLTLLAKLDLLVANIRLSDVGLLIHQVSNHHYTSQNNSVSPKGIGVGFGECDAPSLSFEEFLVYLCIFADLLKDTSMDISLLMERIVTLIPRKEKSESPRFSRENSYSEIFASNREDLTIIKLSDYWFQMWEKYMKSSTNFSGLLQEIILPKLKKYPLLESPEDARQRDMYSCVFSLEVLLAIEEIETKLSTAFARSRSSGDDEAYKFEGEIKCILTALESLNFAPQLVAIKFVMKIAHSNFEQRSSGKSSKDADQVLYSLWEWVICVIAFHIVEAISASADRMKYDFLFTSGNRGNKNYMVADIIKQIASAL